MRGALPLRWGFDRSNTVTKPLQVTILSFLNAWIVKPCLLKVSTCCS